MRTLMEPLYSGNSPLPDLTSIVIARDFSATPYGRYREDGIESGEVFREDILMPALKMGRVELDIDGLDGLPSSFWEEALGGMVRKGLSLDTIEKNLTILCTDPELTTFKRSGWRFIRDAAEKKTEN